MWIQKLTEIIQGKRTAAGCPACRSRPLRPFVSWRTCACSSCVVQCFSIYFYFFPVCICCEDLIYGRKFDNALRVSCKSNAVPEAVLEQENVQAEWGKILDLLKNEEIERKAAAQLMTQPDQGAGEQCEIELLRKPPSQHSEGSESYFKAIANQTVRTYCCFNPEPKTLEGMISWSSSVLQNFQGEVGQSCVVTHLDCDALGESFGPSQQSLLRKRFNPDVALIRKLLHGSMIGRNAQRKGDEAHCPAEGEVVMVHTGFDRSSKDVESAFRPSTARKDQPIDAEQKDLTIVYTDKSIRNRKKKNRGAYSSKSMASLFSAVPLTTLLPEMAYPEFSGHNTADVFFGVEALQPEELLTLSRTCCFPNTHPQNVKYQTRHIVVPK